MATLRCAMPDGRAGMPRRSAWAARLLVISSALPYLALPLGSSTNLPLSTLLAGWLLVSGVRNTRILVATTVLLAAPLAASGLRMFVSAEPWSLSGQLTWVFYVLPLPGMAIAVLRLRAKIVPWLAWTITASSCIALVQKFLYLDRGVVPWLWAYDAPGYASVRELAPVLAQYVRRPFGLFPESSFLAGTLTMMVMGMVVLDRRLTGTLRLSGYVAVLAGCLTIAVSGSGSTIVGLGLIAATVVAPMIRRHLVAAMYTLPVVLGGALWYGLNGLNVRATSFNWSWADRTASLVGSLRLLSSDPSIFLLGIGRGQTTSYFTEDRVPLLGLQHYSQLTDIFSVLGRIVLENGILFGLPILLWMGAMILTSGSPSHRFPGFAALLCWLTAGGVAISYDSAFWIFGLPGLLFGLSLIEPSGLTDAARSPGTSLGTETNQSERSIHADPAYRQ